MTNMLVTKHMVASKDKPQFGGVFGRQAGWWMALISRIRGRSAVGVLGRAQARRPRR